MPDPHTFEARLADAMRRYSDHAPTDVDATALAREIAGGSTKAAHQRPRWWPFGRSNHEPGRSRTMFIASGATAVIAVAALGASLALTTIWPSNEAGVPPGVEAPTVGDDWTFFRGTLTFDGSAVPVVETLTQDGMVIQRGGGWTGQSMVADDPRMTGQRTEINDVWSDLAGGSGDIWTSLVTIENDEGRWLCSTTGVGVDGGELAGESGWCDGEGAYAGLRAYVVFDLHDAGEWTEKDVYGFITATDGPRPLTVPAE